MAEILLESPDPGSEAATAPPCLDNPIWSERRVAQHLGQSVRSVKRLRRAGDGPDTFRVSKHRAEYRVTDVMAWLAARQEPAA